MFFAGEGGLGGGDAALEAGVVDFLVGGVRGGKDGGMGETELTSIRLRALAMAASCCTCCITTCLALDMVAGGWVLDERVLMCLFL